MSPSGQHASDASRLGARHLLLKKKSNDRGSKVTEMNQEQKLDAMTQTEAVDYHSTRWKTTAVNHNVLIESLSPKCIFDDRVVEAL